VFYSGGVIRGSAEYLHGGRGSAEYLHGGRGSAEYLHGGRGSAECRVQRAGRV
jgi:hypothetical protein